jgi:hypothetical protein
MRFVTQRRAIRSILTALFAAALMAGCGPGGQEEASVDAGPPAMTGEVLTVDAMTRTIELKGAAGESGAYRVDADAQILSGGSKIEFQDLAPGDRVAVDADERDGRMVATYIEVVEE